MPSVPGKEQTSTAHEYPWTRRLTLELRHPRHGTVTSPAKPHDTPVTPCGPPTNGDTMTAWEERLSS